MACHCLHTTHFKRIYHYIRQGMQNGWLANEHVKKSNKIRLFGNRKYNILYGWLRGNRNAIGNDAETQMKTV